MQFLGRAEYPLKESSWESFGTDTMKLAEEYPADEDDSNVIDFEEWAANSFKQAKEFGYDDYSLPMTKAYRDGVQELTRYQLMLGGRNLAKVLVHVFRT
jgi:hypothetical protein